VFLVFAEAVIVVPNFRVTLTSLLANLADISAACCADLPFFVFVTNY